MTRADRIPAVPLVDPFRGAARRWTVPDTAQPLPRRAQRREADWWRRAATAVRGALAAVPQRMRRPYYPPPREGFIEDAAMAREMWRL